MSVGKAFDQVAVDYQATFSEKPVAKAMRDAVHRIYDRFLQKGDRILDMGCGPGPDFPFFAQKGCEVWGIDASEKMIEVAQKCMPQAHLQVMDYNHLDQLEGSFDAICANFGCLNTQLEFDVLAEKMAAKLKPKGYFLANVMTPFCLAEFLFLVSRAKYPWIRGKKPKDLKVGQDMVRTVYHEPYAWFKKHFASQFELVTVRGQGICLPPPYAHRQPQKLISILAPIDRILSGLWPLNTLADHSLLVLQRKSEPC